MRVYRTYVGMMNGDAMKSFARALKIGMPNAGPNASLFMRQRRAWGKNAYEGDTSRGHSLGVLPALAFLERSLLKISGGAHGSPPDLLTFFFCHPLCFVYAE